MKTALIATGLALMTLTAQARHCRYENPVGGSDLVKNVGGSFLVGAAVTSATGNPMHGIATTTTLAFMKEASDIHRTHHVCSLGDLLQKISGGIAGSLGAKFFIVPDGKGLFIGYAKEF